MSEQKEHYKLFIERVRTALKGSPDELRRWIKLSDQYVKAASDMTKDELALIEAFFKRDVQTFSEQYNKDESQSDDAELFRSLLVNTLWAELLEITDKTQLEWHDVLRDIRHHGVYQAGEVVGLGMLVCEDCSHQTSHCRVGLLTPCIECGCKRFIRKAFPA